MTAERNQEAAGNAHVEVWELLPWYANATLSAEEDLRVEQHLAACALCQRELERCRHLSVAAKSVDEKAWAPSPRHFAQVLAHIDSVEATRTTTAKASITLPDRVRGWFFGTPRPVRWAFALQGALVLFLAAGLLLTATPPTPEYETLSRPGDPVAVNRAQLRMVFTDDVTGKDLRALLQSVDGQIVHGPSSTGVYTVELPIAATAQERLSQALATVRSHPKVQLAEPVGAGSVR